MKHLTEHELQQMAGRPGSEIPVEIGEHVRQCSRCRAELAAYRSLFAVLAEAPQAGLSPAFADSVMQRIEKERSRPFDYLEWGLFGFIILVGVPMVLHYVNWSFLSDGIRDSARSIAETWKSSSEEDLPIFADTKVYLVLLAALIVIGFDRLQKAVLRHK